MKIIVIGSTTAWIFGQAAGLPQWADLSSTAAVIVLLGFVICRLIPKMQEQRSQDIESLVLAFRDERRLDREQLAEEFSKCRLRSNP
jgi:hypothetical protein